MTTSTDPGVTRLEAGPFQTNTYLLQSGDEAVLVDPGTDSSLYLGAFRFEGVSVKAIISTHGHLDHVFDIPDLKSALHCPFMMGEGDDDILRWSYSVSEKYMGKPLQEVTVDRYLSEGTTITFGNSTMEVLKLPGHTPGSIGLVTGSLFLTGDTLFMGTIGRTDLGGSMEEMERTLRRIRNMDPGLRVLPGHGPETKLSDEIERNHFLA